MSYTVLPMPYDNYTHLTEMANVNLRWAGLKHRVWMTAKIPRKKPYVKYFEGETPSNRVVVILLDAYNPVVHTGDKTLLRGEETKVLHFFRINYDIFMEFWNKGHKLDAIEVTQLVLRLIPV